MLIGRVGADNQEIVTGFKVAVTGSGGEDGYISGLDGDLAPVFSAKHQTGVAGREAEDFMGSGVIVVEIVDAVAPLRRPAVTLEDLLEDGCGIGIAGSDGGAVEQDGETLVVRHPAVAGKVEEFWLHGALKGGSGRGEAECPEEALKRRRSMRLMGVVFFQFSGGKMVIRLGYS